MRVSIVTYQGYDGAGVLHAHHFANELVELGQQVQMLLLGQLATASLLADPPRYAVHEVQFEAGLLDRASRRALEQFAPDIVHLWTPRHLPARVGLEAWDATDARLVIHYEDDEEHILSHAANTYFSGDDVELYRLFRGPGADLETLSRVSRGIKREFVRHTLFEPRAWPWIHPLVTPVVEKLASGYTAISPALRLLLPREPGRPATVLYPGVDAERFRPRPKPRQLVADLGLEGRTVLLYSGSIAPVHDFVDVLRALPPVVRRHPDVVLVQLGHNYMRQTTDAMIAELDLSRHVVFAGPASHENMPDHLALADAFVGAVRADAFNCHRLPAKIPEYMAMGRPMIVMAEGVGYELDDPAEVIKVAGSEPELLAQGLFRLLECRGNWPAMGGRLRQKAQDIFAWRRNTEHLLAFYDEVLQAPESPDQPAVPQLEELHAGAVRSASPSRTARLDVLILTEARIGEEMSGVGIRYLELARHLGEHFEVALGQPHQGGSIPGVDVFDWSRDPRAALDLASQARVVLVHGYVLEKLPGLRSIPGRLVVDLYCPFVFENIEIHRDRGLPLAERDAIHRGDLAVLLRQLRCGDYFLCAADAQRDWLLGLLTALGRIDPGACEGPTAAEDFVGIVPFGLPGQPAARAPRPVLRGVWPGVGPDDVVLLWGGGLWSWLDPLTVIEAMARVRRQQGDVTLVFLSTLAPDLSVEMPMIGTALELASRRGLLGKGVVFNQDRYIGYSERLAFFAEADVGITAHARTLETHFAFRTRALDYMNAGLPIITTEGDFFAGRVKELGLGRVVAFDDAAMWAEAILALSGDTAERHRCRERVLAARDAFTWPRCVEPLVRYVQRVREGSAPRLRAERGSPGLETGSPPAGDGASLADGATSPGQLRDEVLARLQGVAQDRQALLAELAAWQEHALRLEARVDAVRRIPFAARLWRLLARTRGAPTL
jgi:glycosyltransferase involved in cell wall biosynthesis